MASKVDSGSGAPQKAQRDRSPAYPFISLRAAVERVTAFDAKFGRHAAPLAMAGLAWGYKGDGSQAAQTLSPLRYFGLLEYQGATDKRVAALTEDARNLLRAQQASTKAEILRVCALRPKAMQRYWAMWNADRPPDEVCLDQLVIKDCFTEAAAKTFLRVYDDTIEYAGLTKSDNIDASDVSQSDGGDDVTDVPEVGVVGKPPLPAAGSDRAV